MKSSEVIPPGSAADYQSLKNMGRRCYLRNLVWERFFEALSSEKYLPVKFGGKNDVWRPLGDSWLKKSTRKDQKPRNHLKRNLIMRPQSDPSLVNVQTQESSTEECTGKPHSNSFTDLNNNSISNKNLPALPVRPEQNSAQEIDDICTWANSLKNESFEYCDVEGLTNYMF